MKGKHQHHHRHHALRSQTTEQPKQQTTTVKSAGKGGYRFNLKPMVEMSLLGAFIEMLKSK